MSPNRKYSPSPDSRSSPSFSLSSHSDDARHPFILEPDRDGYRSPVSKSRYDQKRSFLHSLAAFFAALCLFALFFFGFLIIYPRENRVLREVSPVAPHPKELVDPFSYDKFVRGPPTAHFRDNLLPDAKYITSWISAGWTNDVMTYINLIYLGLITERIPIVPMFIPSHIGGSVPPVDFGKVFDVPRLIKLIRSPVLEWHQVKSRNSTEVDELGCWNTFQAVKEDETRPRYSPVPDLLHLDLSYTMAPSWIKVIPHFQHDFHAYFWSLAALAFPEQRKENMVAPLPSPGHHVSLPPDEHLLCYDYLYYVCANQPYEFDFDYSPAWRYVGQHMHWAPDLKDLANEYIRRTLRVEEGLETPPYIGIHIRHGDFKNWCGDVPLSDCFAPLSVISRRVDEIKAELWERKGLNINHVIMTSDERDTAWWDEVINLGWYTVDHSQTVELYGDWYPVFIDAVIQSSGVGFVGTDRSTMSTLARRRVQSWQNGVVRTIKWGRPDSDDH